MFRIKRIAILLALCLVVSVLLDAGPALAAFSNEKPATDHNENFASFIAPDIIEKAEAEANDYVGRVKEDETDLYTLIFKSNDGSNTMRVFSHPVKYIDERGETRDISLKIAQNKDGTFSAVDHMINANFSSSTEGEIEIALGYDNVEIEMKASGTPGLSRNAVLSEDKRSLTYSFDDKTSYVYSLTYLGIKENIVVSEYTGQTEYKFILRTNGLHPIKIADSIFLADENGKIKASIGDIIIFTADEKNNTIGDLLFDTVIENLEYTFTISLDEAFLKSEKTLYPIIIDPTIEISYDNNGTGAIEDVTINSLTDSDPLSWSLFVGLRETYGIARVLMRFPNLNIPVKFDPLILSAQVEIRDLLCQGDEDITVYCYSYSENAPTWSESGSVSWSYVGTSYVDSYLDSHLVSYGQGNVAPQRYGFNITSLVKLWADGVKSPEKGIVFKAHPYFENQTGNDINYWYKTFSSYNRAAFSPSLTIKYEKQAVFTIRNYANGSRYLTATGTYSGGATFSTSLDELDGTQLWCIEYLTAYDAVNIVSMGLRYSGGKKPFVVYNFTDITGLGVQHYSSAYKRYQPIRYSQGFYYFKNKENSCYLSISNSYEVLENTTVKNQKSQFYLAKITTSTFNNFWSGGYSAGIYDGVAHIKIQLDSSIAAHSLYSGNDFSAALLWNGVTENVVIYGPTDAVPNGITPFVVTFAADASVGSAGFGVTIPNGYSLSSFTQLSSSQQNALLVSDWSSVTIYLNGIVGTDNPFYSNVSDINRADQINKTICHEMGHALKLAHPIQSNSSGSRHTFPNCRGNYESQQSVYAVMNQGLFYNETISKLTAASPQAHDMTNLNSKWEYHITCSH